MDSSVVLVYVGDRDGQRRYVPGYPSADITNEQLIDMAQSEGKSPAEMQAFLLSHAGVWELPESAESATIEEQTATEAYSPFRDDLEQTAGEAASGRQRRRES